MNELIKDITARELEQISSNITEGVGKIIEQSKGSIAVYLNSKVVLTYWNIGKYIAKEIDLVGEEKYGTKIVATVSQQLAERYGDGYSIRCLGRFRSPAGKVYFLYEIINDKDRNFKTGLRTFDLFEDDVIDIYRPATYDEMMEIMHGERMEVLAN